MNSAISWVGGKRLLRKYILPLLPKHNLYCEVFGGAGWMLFGKSNDKNDYIADKKLKYTEVFNDINGELINFWRYVSYHSEAFRIELDKYLVSREIFEELIKSTKKTELERAIVFYYLLDTSYGSQSLNFCITKGSNTLPLRKIDKIQKISERLAGVSIENMDFAQLITRYDDENTLFYLDPPYFKKEYLYKRDDIPRFDRHDELCKILCNIKGKFILSYNDDEYVRELYSGHGFIIEELKAPYSIGGRGQSKKEFNELLIRNFS